MIRPFAQIREVLRDADIYIDSTVFVGGTGTSEDDVHHCDFSDAPSASHWFFDNDPLSINPEGEFLEIPIASYHVSPDFYWRFAIAKMFGGAMHWSFGNGVPIRISHSGLLKKLSQWTDGVVTMDGYKASFLEDAFRRYELMGKTDFVVMGHPKALSRYSLQKLERFIARRNVTEFVGYGAYRSLLAGRESHGTRGILMRITLLATMFALFYAFNAVPHDEILVAAAEREDSG